MNTTESLLVFQPYRIVFDSSFDLHILHVVVAKLLVTSQKLYND